MGRIKRIWYLSPIRAARVQASLCIRAVSPEPRLLAHTSNESRGTFRQKARSLAPLNGWACAVKICHEGMLEDTNSLDALHVCCNCQGAVNFSDFKFQLSFWFWCSKLNLGILPFYLLQMSHLVTKPTKWHVRPAKTQISLGIRPV